MQTLEQPPWPHESTMKALLLGTTGYHPNDRRQTACMMLPDLGVLLDAGTAMYRVGDYLQTDTIDIFLSHAHLDHIIGLTYLFDLLSQHPLERITVHGEQEKLDAVRDHLFSKPLFPVSPPFTMQPLADQTPLADGSILTYFGLRHPGGSVGYRIDWPDRSMAYVTDTVATEDAPYIDKIRGVDLLLHECFFADGMTEKSELTGHSCLTPVAKIAAEAQVGRMVLVHIHPQPTEEDRLDLTQARRIFPRIEIGQDRMEVEF
jgi:ribonuclease Z